MSTSCIDNSNPSKTNLDKTRNTKTASNGNLFARALNYAFKKTPRSDSALMNGTWKAKLGKYLNSSGPSHKSTKSKNNLEGCNLDMDDDLNATYHLSRQIPKKNQNDEVQSDPLNSGNKIINNNPSVNHSSNQLFLCLSSSSSSSASNNSTSLSTPASFEAQNNLLKGEY